MCTCLYVYTSAYTYYIYIHTHKCTYTYRYVYIYMYTYTNTHICTYIHTHAHTHICIYLFTYIYICIHIHICYLHTQVCNIHTQVCIEGRTFVMCFPQINQFWNWPGLFFATQKGSSKQRFVMIIGINWISPEWSPQRHSFEAVGFWRRRPPSHPRARPFVLVVRRYVMVT